MYNSHKEEIVEIINIAETFYSATKDNHRLRDVFIEMGFKPMQNNQTYLTVGRIITLKKALDNIGVSVEQANSFLKENGMEVKLSE